MRIGKRAQEISIAQTELELLIHAFFDGLDVDMTEMLRAVTLEIREILLDMPPKVERAEKYSYLKNVIQAHQEEKGMTNIEVVQALTGWCSGQLKYMLRYERHGNYDKPAMEA